MIIYYIKRLIRILIDTFATIIGVIYPKNQHFLPPITDRLLIEPAISLSNKIKEGKIKSEDVMKAFINRINTVEPHINALIQNRFDLALKEAIDVDKRVQNELSGNGLTNGVSIHSLPFLGIPFTVKDSIAVKDMYFTSGSIKRKGITADEDAVCVSLMRKSGAIPIGMTNTPEMLMWWDAYNKLYGRTNNPYDKSRVTGGSCGGEAAILAAAGSVIGVGGDLGGSIRIPANFCGVFGHKGTSQIVSVEGHWPKRCEHRYKHLSFGPMCRYASDLRPMLKVMAGDKGSQLLKLDEHVDISKLNVYYVEDYIPDPSLTPVNSEIKDAIKKSVQFFAQKGAKVSCVKIDNMQHAFNIWFCALQCNDSLKLSEELTNRNGAISPLWELVKHFFGLSDHTLAAIMASIVENRVPSDAVLRKYTKLCDDLRNEVHQLLGNNGILLYASHPETAPKLNTTLFKYANCAYTAIFNVINVTATHVPMGLSKNGLPLGLQVIAGPFMDHVTLTAAEELEKQFGGWTPPSRIMC